MAKSTETSIPFGSAVPFAEPSWYGALGHHSPYYKDSHRKLRQFCREYVDSWKDEASKWEDDGQVPDSAFKRHAKLGFVAASIHPLEKEYLDKAGITLPAGIQPSEWDQFHSIIVTDELTRSGFLGVNWGMGGGNGIGGPPLVRFGTKELKDELLPSLLKGDIRVCLGVTEPGAGSDVAQIKTSARKEGDFYVVNGVKVSKE